ncbi:penicillin-binding protein 2 [Arachnia propionica]|uniref:Penicillin-binding protein 2 n=1 Tax=Arachnia propionica TaxID=1750 RepID=A0A3P1WXJ7_9ACTN|nr:penicillin-binding transpeptidase domain-containing protein [Arachnia propionica]RRD50776.1 penicillin-binding protein 2 [Arachnia propionica]
MNGPLRKVSLFIGLLLTALLVNITWISIGPQAQLNADSRNKRVRDAEFSTSRGAILVGNDPIAVSVPSDGRYPWERTFPQGTTWSSVTGWYSYTYGRQELERSWNEELSGTDSSQTLNRIIDLLTGRQPVGATLNTTLNPAAQKAAVEALGNKQGAAVAIDYTTGEVLALVSSPTYDPNLLTNLDYATESANWEQLLNDPSEPLKNRAVREVYPPGSTFKLVIAAAALEAGLQPSSEVDAPASYRLPGSSHSMGNSTNCGGTRITLAAALATSCNTSFGILGVELGADKVRSMAERFGFNSDPRIDLPSATSRFPKELDEAQLALSSIGQYEVASSPLQMAMVTAAIANDGVLMRPHLVRTVAGNDLKIVQTVTPERMGEPLSANNAALLRQMMEGVVSDGTGKPAAIDGLTIGGKTGTAQSDPNRPPYAWFVGYAVEPHVAVAVFVSDAGLERDDISGGRVAAPIFKAIVEAVR